ncbi:MAG: hypothetical protein QM569_09885 [Acidovorax sp.]|uniref:hypothetical protein n=1 Tax=Acidovorax sp. TaxID=1872122 RepID=UPI0039E58D7F
MRLARFTSEARSELLAQTAYYETIRKGLGARFRTEIAEGVLICAVAGDYQMPEYWLSRVDR